MLPLHLPEKARIVLRKIQYSHPSLHTHLYLSLEASKTVTEFEERCKNIMRSYLNKAELIFQVTCQLQKYP